MRVNSTVLVTAWSCAILAGGCTKNDTGPTMLAQRAQPYVEDIPVPKGFELQLKKSAARRYPGGREIDHIYEGREDPIAVRSFYEHYMPDSGWKLIDETLRKGDGVQLMTYRKGSEQCEIRIERAPAAIIGRVTQVRASIRSEDA